MGPQQKTNEDLRHQRQTNDSPKPPSPGPQQRASSSRRRPHQQQQQHQQRQRDLEVARLRRRLEATGEIDRLRRDLRVRLLECGWHDVLADRAKESIRRKGSLTDVTVDELASELMSAGRATVPREVKDKALRRLRAVLGSSDDDEGNGGASFP